jgi:indole-3-glycerol phosphate synthase
VLLLVALQIVAINNRNLTEFEVFAVMQINEHVSSEKLAYSQNTTLRSNSEDLPQYKTFCQLHLPGFPYF